MKQKTKEFITATRYWSLTASAIPVIITMSYIFYQKENFQNINWIFGIIALIATLLFHLAGNLFNDYFDYKFNVDREDTMSSRMLVDKQFMPKQILIAASSFLILGISIGIFLTIKTNWSLLIVGILGFLGTVFYNFLKYHALGDLCIFIVYGQLISLGMAFVMLNQFYWIIILITVPIGLLIVGILHANNTRDIINDSKANIKTFAMILKLKNSKIYFVLLIGLSYLFILVLIILKILSPLCLLVFISFPFAKKTFSLMLPVKIDELDNIKQLTEIMAKYVLVFGGLLIVANFIAGLF
ncbi:MAG: prenyltransferase [Bacteroidales bacterium]|jgi:1,4-dihydroxy-2-naphthoate octaprenyltransferase|nr:prenyltransferase [Bacteroidales bacterium]